MKLKPKQELIKNRRVILREMTVEKAEKYPDLYSTLFESADSIYKMEIVIQRDK